jgi:hypothetical protein
MKRDLAGSQISESQYERLLELCAHDPAFPPSHAQWLAEVAANTELALREGRNASPVKIVTEDFAAWCRLVNEKPCFDALRAYVITCRTQVQPFPRRAGSTMAGP